MKVIQTEFGTAIDILFNLDPYTARPIMVESDDVEADANGRKIVKAGTPLDKDGKLANDASARYILLKDVDVTYGDAAGAGVYRGTLNLAKINKNLTVDEEEPFELSEAAQVALKGIIFMSDEDIDYVPGTPAATVTSLTAGDGITITADEEDPTAFTIAAAGE